jgi:hypothetical protein
MCAIKVRPIVLTSSIPTDENPWINLTFANMSFFFQNTTGREVIQVQQHLKSYHYNDTTKLVWIFLHTLKYNFDIMVLIKSWLQALFPVKFVLFLIKVKLVPIVLKTEPDRWFNRKKPEPEPKLVF